MSDIFCILGVSPRSVQRLFPLQRPQAAALKQAQSWHLCHPSLNDPCLQPPPWTRKPNAQRPPCLQAWTCPHLKLPWKKRKLKRRAQWREQADLLPPRWPIHWQCRRLWHMHPWSCHHPHPKQHQLVPTPRHRQQHLLTWVSMGSQCPCPMQGWK